MTRARALKQTIRARAEKTGERYTTARRHILRELNDKTRLKVDEPKADEPKGSSLQVEGKASTKVATKGGLSDAKSIEKTGHGLEHWFAILDRFGAVEKGHTAATKMLDEHYDVPGWYVQGIVVAYERARGKRVMNQRCDGAFEVSVSKVIAAKTPALVKAFTDAKQRKAWSIDADPGLVKALEAGLKDPKSKGFITRPDGQARFRFKWDGMTVQFNLYPKGPGKTSIVAQQIKLPGADSVEQYRAIWKTAFAAIAAAVSEA
jgi:hypothetical protein